MKQYAEDKPNGYILYALSNDKNLLKIFRFSNFWPRFQKFEKQK